MKVSELVVEIAELYSKLAEEIATMLDDTIAELERWADAYYDYLRLSRASGDFEHIKNRRRQSFALPRLLTRVWRSGAKLWKVNRAVYRPYDWRIVLIRSDIIRA